jgi:hypothetical protein
MTDYEKQLSFYADAETREQTVSYFEKYWLSEYELTEKWLPIMRGIYEIAGERFPNVKFRLGFDFIALRGGAIFDEKDFSLLQECMKEIGDTSFVVLEHLDPVNPFHNEPPLRFIYPVEVTWNKLLSGAYVSKALFRNPVKEYFVFGDSGAWGKYVANDYIWPLDLVGFRPALSALFRKRFQSLIEPEIVDWLPSNWR